MKISYLILSVFAIGVLASCGSKNHIEAEKTPHAVKQEKVAEETEFKYLVDQFADIKVLRYNVPGFSELSLKEKKMLYYLYEAALAGRDITWDQNFKHNITIRRTIEAIFNSYKGDKTTGEYKKFVTYAKQVWFANGIHHHYSNDKFTPQFSKKLFKELITKSDASIMPLESGETVADLITKLTPILFDKKLYAKRVNLDATKDLIKSSANNFYEGVTQAEAEAFYAAKTNKKDKEPVSFGLNSKLVKENGVVTEKVWKVGGMYDKAISKIVYWLEKAAPLAKNEQQQKTLEALIVFYKTGDLKEFDNYNKEWVKDTDSRIDVVNGFIEVYGDPLGYRGSFESVVSIKDMEASKRIEAIGSQAQWFEDHSTIMPEHKKKNVQGISAKVITVIVESGDASPSTPIGINLPNSNWIRSNYGSKSVNLGNIVEAYDEASKTGGGMLKEFAYTEEEIVRSKKFGSIGDKLHTDMHEVIGHASGKINEGVGTPKETLKNYSSTLEEGRADLVALYYLMDQKLIDIGVMESLEVGRASYDDYIRGGLITQLTRLKLGDDIEEAHMRNRQFISKWCLEKGKDTNVIEKKVKGEKTYYVVNDYKKLRVLFGQLLKELQRIKSEGDYEAGKAIVENYGVKVDQALHKEVLERFAALKIAPYSGFVNPELIPVMEGDSIKDIKISYKNNFEEQMLDYGKNHSLLPNYN